MGKAIKVIKRVLSIVLGIIIVVSSLSIMSNMLLLESQEDDASLTVLEKAQLSEAINLIKTKGDSVWPGWGQLGSAFLVYNQENAFLVNLQQPGKGWQTIPSLHTAGIAWEIVPNDLYNNTTYFRQKLSSDRPQGFVVQVDSLLAPSMATKTWMKIDMSIQIRESFNPVIKNFIPYRLIAKIASGSTDKYISLLAHEHFHAFQGHLNRQRLFDAENLSREQGANYPWHDAGLNELWRQEVSALYKALTVKNNEEFIPHVERFIRLRKERYEQLDSLHIRMERLKEWEEGLAKYAELDIWKNAGDQNIPNGELINLDSEFDEFKKFDDYWHQELTTMTFNVPQDEVRFYYSGMAQAFILDRLSTEWKQMALSPGAPFLDQLIEDMLLNL